MSEFYIEIIAGIISLLAIFASGWVAFRSRKKELEYDRAESERQKSFDQRLESMRQQYDLQLAKMTEMPRIQEEIDDNSFRRANDMIDRLQSEVNNLRDRVAHLEEKYNEKAIEHEKLLVEAAQLKERNSVLTKEKRKLETTVDRYVKITEQGALRDEKLRLLLEELAESRNLIIVREHERDQLRNKLRAQADVSEKVRALQGELEKSKLELIEVKRQKDEAVGLVVTGETEVAEHLKAAVKDRDSAMRMVSAASAKIDELKNQIDSFVDLSPELRKAQAARKEAEDHVTRLIDALHKANEESQRKQEELREAMTQSEARQAQLRKAEREAKTVKPAVVAGKATPDTTRTTIAHARDTQKQAVPEKKTAPIIPRTTSLPVNMSPKDPGEAYKAKDNKVPDPVLYSSPQPEAPKEKPGTSSTVPVKKLKQPEYKETNAWNKNQIEKFKRQGEIRTKAGKRPRK